METVIAVIRMIVWGVSSLATVLVILARARTDEDVKSAFQQAGASADSTLWLVGIFVLAFALDRVLAMIVEIWNVADREDQ